LEEALHYYKDVLGNYKKWKLKNDQGVKLFVKTSKLPKSLLKSKNNLDEAIEILHQNLLAAELLGDMFLLINCHQY